MLFSNISITITSQHKKKKEKKNIFNQIMIYFTVNHEIILAYTAH